MIDHILINNKWRRCTNNSRAFPSADIGSDHQLLMANIRLKLKVQKKSATLLHYDTKKLDEPPTSREYETEVSKRLLPMIEAIETNHDDVNVMYAKVVGAFNDTAKKVLGKVKKTSKRMTYRCHLEISGGKKEPQVKEKRKCRIQKAL